jgi:hypothetical protein
MGAEVPCRAIVNGKAAKGRARIETEVLEFRGGALTLKVPFGAMTDVAASDGTLRIEWPDGTARFDLGAHAAKWVDSIRHPKTRLEKLGVKPDFVVSAIGSLDAAFTDELRGRASRVVVGRAVKASDAIFFAASREADLAAVARLKAALKPSGALWIVRPKGRPEISESAVMRAGKAAGLVDVKVVRFSATHTAEKFVIPVAARH